MRKSAKSHFNLEKHKQVNGKETPQMFLMGDIGSISLPFTQFIFSQLNIFTILMTINTCNNNGRRLKGQQILIEGVSA